MYGVEQRFSTEIQLCKTKSAVDGAAFLFDVLKKKRMISKDNAGVFSSLTMQCVQWNWFLQRMSRIHEETSQERGGQRCPSTVFFGDEMALHIYHSTYVNRSYTESSLRVRLQVPTKKRRCRRSKVEGDSSQPINNSLHNSY